MPLLTHDRAVAWAANRLNAEPVGRGAGYHLRGRDGRRIRVAGRHIKGRMPNYFSLGTTLAGDPFDDVAVILFSPNWDVLYAYRVPLDAARTHHKQPGVQGCRLMINGDDSWQEDARVESLA